MPILLIRHGETSLNVARTLQPAATPLSAHGIAQARALAQRLERAGIGSILASDLPRAWQTAEALAAACGAPLQASALLHERNFGDLRGLPYDTLGYNPLAMDGAPPGGESMSAFRDRVDAAFDAALALQAITPGDVAVVTHGLVIRDLVMRRLRLRAGISAPATIRNTSVTIFSAVPPHDVELLDDVAHLGGDSAASCTR